MSELKIDMIATDEFKDIEQLLAEVESWSNRLFAAEWDEIEASYSYQDPESDRQKNQASRHNYERHLVIETLRTKLCRG